MDDENKIIPVKFKKSTPVQRVVMAFTVDPETAQKLEATISRSKKTSNASFIEAVELLWEKYGRPQSDKVQKIKE